MKEFGKRFEPGSGGFSRYGCFSFPGRGCFFVPHGFFFFFLFFLLCLRVPLIWCPPICRCGCPCCSWVVADWWVSLWVRFVPALVSPHVLVSFLVFFRFLRFLLIYFLCLRATTVVHAGSVA